MSDSQLPSGWSRKPLGDVARIEGGGTPSRAIDCYWVDGTIPWATPTDITACSNRNLFSTKEKITARGFAASAAKLLPKYTVLMTSRATVGESKVAQVECCTNQGFKNLIANRDTDPWFLYYQMQRLKEDYRNFGIGSTFLEVSKKDTDRFLIDIPSYAEQQSIADILTTIDNLIDHTESLIAKYQSIKQGMMHDLFTRGVDANGRLRPPRDEAPELYKESALGWIPREWEVVQLSTAISSIDAGKSFESPDIPAAPGEWGVLKVSAVHPDGFRSIENKVITKEIYINAKYQVLNGDLLITRANTPDLVGLSCIVENPRERLLLCDKTLRLKVNNSFNKKYIFYALQTDTMRIQIQISGTGSSGSMKNITQSDIYSLILSAPELKEQQHIQEALHHIDALIHSEKTHLHKINCLKLGLMHDLLTGTVRIPPHLTPAQEPPHAV